MNKLKQLRLAAGLSQEELAKQLRVNQTAISQYESGQTKPRADKLVKLAKILGCTVDELLKS